VSVFLVFFFFDGNTGGGGADGVDLVIERRIILYLNLYE